MKRAWLLWTLFALCLAIALAAMAWISATVLRLDRMQAEAARQAQLEENVRLALWRMDSFVAPLIAQETARPYFAYSAFTPAERAYTRMFSEIQYGDVLVPSPLLDYASPFIHLHFQFLPDGTLVSPQVPGGGMRNLATPHTTWQHLQLAAARLEQLRRLLSREELLAVLPDGATEPAWPATQPLAQPYAGSASGGNEAEGAQRPMPAAQAQQAKSVAEQQVRAQSLAQASNYDALTSRARTAMKVAAPSVPIREGVMKPVWIGDALLLARQVSIGDQDYIQGCWLDWPAIQSSLLGGVRDLLPSAQLEPVATHSLEQPRQLATIPARLIPGPISYVKEPATSPLRMTLLVAWICVLMGCVAIAALVWGALSLSQRRGAFVSAVTHELRTPLTTVSMYAEMLEEGMIADEQKRRRYLSTLRAEAERLGHLVENVLAYSRIERGSANGRIQTLPLSQLVEGITGRLTTRAEQARMELCIEINPATSSLQVRADAGAVEQILFNLVDNAGKYAASATDRRVHLQASADRHRAFIHIRDHGPGISTTDARRLFRPFSKSARDAANSAPGVGLGLALSRRLAREMRGDLRLQPATTGADFLLTLPVA
jgi:signal transduction histidine kinase